jgi:hypothetical protein
MKQCIVGLDKNNAESVQQQVKAIGGDMMLELGRGSGDVSLESPD